MMWTAWPGERCVDDPAWLERACVNEGLRGKSRGGRILNTRNVKLAKCASLGVGNREDGGESGQSNDHSEC